MDEKCSDNQEQQDRIEAEWEKQEEEQTEPNQEGINAANNESSRQFRNILPDGASENAMSVIRVD